MLCCCVGSGLSGLRLRRGPVRCRYWHQHGLGWQDVNKIEFPGYAAMWNAIVDGQIKGAHRHIAEVKADDIPTVVDLLQAAYEELSSKGIVE